MSMPVRSHAIQLSTGSISSGHIVRATRLRRSGERWTSELTGPWTTQEIDYFEFTYELFHTGLLMGLEVGLPFKMFMAGLLG